MATVEAYSTKAGKRYRVRYRKPGTRTQTDKRGFTTKRDAELFAASVEVSKARGEFIDATAARATVGELGPAWLASKRQRKPSTYAALESAWRVHVLPRWGAVAVKDVTSSAVQDWVTGLSTGKEATGAAAERIKPDPKTGKRWESKPKSAVTVIRCYGVLAAVLDRAVRDRRALFNAARDDVDLPARAAKARVYLTHEQVHDLVREAGPHGTLVLVLAYCGLRWGEATALRVRNLDMLKRRLVIEENAVEIGARVEVGSPKTHERRSVPFPKFLAEQLARACEGKGRDDLVFPGRDGGHLRRSRHATRTSSGGWFEQAVRRAGIPRVTPHDLRHTAASLAVSAGANVKAVQRMLGHKSAAMTLDVYADLFDDDLDGVSLALDQARSLAVVGK